MVVDPQRDVSGYVADAERARPAHRAGHRDPLPRRLPLRAPRAGRGDRRGHLLRRRARSRVPHRHAGRRTASVARRGDPGDPRHPRSHPGVDLDRRVRARHDAAPWAVLTGDTLFIGDVGRPDLLTSVGIDRRRARPTACTGRCTTSSSPCPTPPGCTRPTVPAPRAASTCRPPSSRRSASSGPRTTRCAP